MAQPPNDRLIYVVGNSRSGTTMLSRMLGQSPPAHTLYENHFLAEICPAAQLHEVVEASRLRRMAQQLIARQRDVYSRYVTRRDTGRYDTEAAQLLAALPTPPTPYLLLKAHMRREARRNGKAVAIEQTPHNLFFLSQLLRHEPEARAIILVRDARDVILSQKYKWRAVQRQSQQLARAAWRFWANYHPVTASLMWNQAINAGNAAASHPQVLQIRFEDLVAQTEASLLEICHFLTIPYHSQMLAVMAQDNSSYAAVSERIGVNPDARFRWRRDTSNRYDLAICQQICGQNLQAHHYAIDPYLKPTILDLMRAALSWPFKTGLALLLNPQRAWQVFLSAPRRSLARILVRHRTSGPA